MIKTTVFREFKVWLYICAGYRLHLSTCLSACARSVRCDVKENITLGLPHQVGNNVHVFPEHSTNERDGMSAGFQLQVCC